MVAPLVAAGLTILGGLFNNSAKKKATARQNAYNAPIKVRERAEEAGFNPLLFAGVGVGQQTDSGFSPSMGNSIMQAGIAYAGVYQEQEQLKIQHSQLEMENQRLDAMVKATRMTANVGGIYSGQRKSSAEKANGNNAADISIVNDQISVSINNSRISGDGVARIYDDGLKVPAFRMFGKTFYGSGRVSNGEAFEDGAGEGPLDIVFQPMIVGDTIGHTFGMDANRREYDAMYIGASAAGWFKDHNRTRLRLKSGNHRPEPFQMKTWVGLH